MTESIARFQVNGIEVGSLPRATYETIVRDTRRDRRLYLAYAWALLVAVLRGLGLALRTIPVALIGLLLLVAVVDPLTFTTLIESFRAAEASKITDAVRTVLLYTSSVFCLLFPIAAIAMPSLFALENPFADAVSKKVRGLLRVPTKGGLTVTFHDGATE